MPRVADPDYRERVTTNISTEELEGLEQVAREERTTLAHVLRWAVRDYLANRSGGRRDGVRAVAAS